MNSLTWYLLGNNKKGTQTLPVLEQGNFFILQQIENEHIISGTRPFQDTKFIGGNVIVYEKHYIVDSSYTLTVERVARARYLIFRFSGVDFPPNTIIEVEETSGTKISTTVIPSANRDYWLLIIDPRMEKLLYDDFGNPFPSEWMKIPTQNNFLMSYNNPPETSVIDGFFNFIIRTHREKQVYNVNYAITFTQPAQPTQTDPNVFNRKLWSFIYPVVSVKDVWASKQTLKSGIVDTSTMYRYGFNSQWNESNPQIQITSESRIIPYSSLPVGWYNMNATYAGISGFPGYPEFAYWNGSRWVTYYLLNDTRIRTT